MFINITKYKKYEAHCSAFTYQISLKNIEKWHSYISFKFFYIFGSSWSLKKCQYVGPILLLYQLLWFWKDLSQNSNPIKNILF